MEAELRKIITDGKNKFKVFDDADQALKYLDALKQSEADYTKRVESLKREEAGIGKKLEAARLEADEIRNEGKKELSDAKAQAEKIIEKAHSDVKSYEQQISSSEETLKENAGKISSQKATIKELDKTIEEKQKKLAQIEEERKKALERLGA